MTRNDAAAILRGIIPQGANLKALPPEGKQEITRAVDIVLRLAAARQT